MIIKTRLLSLRQNNKEILSYELSWAGVCMKMLDRRNRKLICSRIFPFEDYKSERVDYTQTKDPFAEKKVAPEITETEIMHWSYCPESDSIQFCTVMWERVNDGGTESRTTRTVIVSNVFYMKSSQEMKEFKELLAQRDKRNEREKAQDPVKADIVGNQGLISLN